MKDYHLSSQDIYKAKAESRRQRAADPFNQKLLALVRMQRIAYEMAQSCGRTAREPWHLEGFREAINNQIASNLAASELVHPITALIYFQVLGGKDNETQKRMEPILAALISLARREIQQSGDYVHFIRLILNRPPFAYLQFLEEDEREYFKDRPEHPNRQTMTLLALGLAQIDSIRSVNGPEAQLDMIPQKMIDAAPDRYDKGLD